jgi:hypothetical protein
MLTKRSYRIALGATLVAFPLVASAQRIVTNGGPWVPDTRGSSVFGLITGANPRYGNGSLQLSVTGDLTDWSWFNLFSGDPYLTQGWGLLSDVSTVGFDWYRVGMPPVGDVPWQEQTPALRLYIRSGDPSSPEFSELVWERYYNVASPTPTDQWVVENLLADEVFWRFVTGEGYTIADCSNPSTITPGIPLKTETPADWGNGSNCFAPNTVVYGIGVGLGSNWPYPYEAYVDNVRLGFGDQNLTVWDNFELADANTTPEPASLVLLASALVGVGGGAMARRRRLRANARA